MPTIISVYLARKYVEKEGKYMKPTEVAYRITDCCATIFPTSWTSASPPGWRTSSTRSSTATSSGRRSSREFYGGFESELESAEKALDGVRIKVPDEVSDETCDVCGRKMVVKTGRFGRFLACPGYPECTFTKPIVVRNARALPEVRQPHSKAHEPQRLHVLRLRKGRRLRLYDVERPGQGKLPEVRQNNVQALRQGTQQALLHHRRVRGPFCPEDQRGYKKKAKPAEENAEQPAAEETAEKPAETEKPAAKRKTAASAAAAKKPAAKKRTAKKAEE